ncbi:MAG: hypothetical protein ABJP48_08035 [Erythrobacter sp.]
MESKFGSRRKTNSSKAVWLAALLSFVAGGALVGYVYWYNANDEQQPEAVETPLAAASPSETPEETLPALPTPEVVASEAAIEEQVEAVEGLAEQQGGLDQRLAAAEQRLARLDLQAQAAAGNAARAEGLLIAFASRRAIERGEELGFLADQLRLRFSDSWPNAVSTVISFSRRPITLDQLLARLDGLAPELSERDDITSWADIKREIGDLFVIRRESTPSSQPQRRLERARLFLESGRVDSAIAEVENLPGASRAENWIADATRFSLAMQALQTLETAAVVEPRRLRDGAGNSVEQLSPVNAPSSN